MTDSEHLPTDALSTPPVKPVVLFIDSDPKSCMYFERFLEDVCTVIIADDIATAKQKISEHDEEIAVAVCDARLVGVDLAKVKWLIDSYPDVVRLMSAPFAKAEEGFQAVGSGLVFRFIERPWDIPTLKAVVREAVDQSSRPSDREPPSDLKRDLSNGLLAASTTRSGRLAPATHDKKQTTFRIVSEFFNALRREAQAKGFESYSNYLDTILRSEFKKLKNRKERIGDVRTRQFRKRKMKTVTFFLSHTLVRTYHALAYQLGYANTSELINEILERNVVPEDDDASGARRV